MDKELNCKKEKYLMEKEKLSASGLNFMFIHPESYLKLFL